MANMSKGAARLRAVLAERGETQYAMAQRAGCMPSGISRVVSGAGMPGRKLAAWLLEDCGIPLEDWDVPAAEDHDAA